MTKQGGGAGLSFGFQKKLTPKVNAGSAKLFSGKIISTQIPILEVLNLFLKYIQLYMA